MLEGQSESEGVADFAHPSPRPARDALWNEFSSVCSHSHRPWADISRRREGRRYIGVQHTLLGGGYSRLDVEGPEMGVYKHG